MFNPLKAREENKQQIEEEEAADEQSAQDFTQQILENDERRVQTNIDLWDKHIEPLTPHTQLTPELVQKIVNNKKLMEKYSKEELIQIMRDYAADLQNLFSTDIVLTYLTERDISLVKMALAFADDTWDLTKGMPLDQQLVIFKKFLREAQLIIETSRGRKGFTATAINSQHIVSENKISRERRGGDQNNFLSKLTGFLNNGSGGGLI